MTSPGIIFRGTRCQSFALNPSLLRKPYPSDAARLSKLENNLWSEFKIRSKQLLGHHVRNAWEALLVMQQHGLPTRLLDWSKSLAVGAYFAAKEWDDRTDAAVWILASRGLMDKTGESGVWETIIGDPSIEPLGLRVDAEGLDAFNEQDPVVLRPDHVSPRIVAQRGVYTLHSFRLDAIEKLALQDRELHGDACFLHKVIIPSDAKAGYLDAVSVVAGVTEEALFPDLDGFARDFVDSQKRYAARPHNQSE